MRGTKYFRLSKIRNKSTKCGLEMWFILLTGRLSAGRKKRVINKMVQFKRIGAAVAIFLALNAILYTHDVTDGRLIPAKGNVLHGFIFREAVRTGSGANVLQAAKAGNILAAQVINTNRAEFGLNN